MFNQKEYHKKWKEKNKERIKEYHRDYMKNYRKNDKLVSRKAKLKNQYNMTIEDYNTLFEEQQGCCWICGIHQSSLKQSLCVDHCHATGRVRGLLCQPCNMMLGGAKDKPETLLKAVEYLNRMQVR